MGIGSATGGARAWTDVSLPSSRLEFDYLQEPQGGSFDVFIDGARAGRVATKAGQAASGFFSFDVPDAPHSVELRTVGDGDVRIFGMALDRAQAGVVVDALGINGAQVFTALRWSEEHFAEQLRHRAPDLVVLAYGTNEALESTLTDRRVRAGRRRPARPGRARGPERVVPAPRPTRPRPPREEGQSLGLLAARRRDLRRAASR